MRPRRHGLHAALTELIAWGEAGAKHVHAPAVDVARREDLRQRIEILGGLELHLLGGTRRYIAEPPLPRKAADVHVDERARSVVGHRHVDLPVRAVHGIQRHRGAVINRHRADARVAEVVRAQWLLGAGRCHCRS